MAEIFANAGLPLIRADNNRVQGHMIMKQMLAPIPLNDPFVKELYGGKDAPKTLPGLIIFDNIEKLVSDIADIQSDEDNPNDCAKQPHEITHTVDACRYFCINRVMEAEDEELKRQMAEMEDERGDMDYESFMCGGDASASYLNY